MQAKIWNRKLHRWSAIIIAVPVIIVIVTGIILQVKKEVHWVQPPTQKVKSATGQPQLSYESLISVVSQIDGVDLKTWDDIDRLDVRPGKGVIKVRGKNRWEVQLNAATGEVLHIAYRRSDLIESIHDGTWFHDSFKLWVFLPVATILAFMWGTGLYLWTFPYLLRAKNKRKSKDVEKNSSGYKGPYQT